MGQNYRATLTAVFGDPVDENPTGVMEEAAYRAAGLDWRYLTLRILPKDLHTAMDAARAFGFRGVNLTIPHKQAVLQYLDDISPAAKIIGAVNTVLNKDGLLWGDNTDGKGFVKSLLDEHVVLEGSHVAILGAGGAARAIAVECALAGASQVTIINRSAGHGQELADLVQSNTQASATYLPWTSHMRIPSGTDIVVQATNIGLYPDVQGCPDIDFTSLQPDAVACDVVFNPPTTLFLAHAAERGLKTINGLGMLVNQGELNFTLWTGLQPPPDVMMQTLKKEFNLH